jgi:hypothetical protein
MVASLNEPSNTLRDQVVPPLEKELIDATADVGTQALEYFKEEHEVNHRSSDV